MLCNLGCHGSVHAAMAVLRLVNGTTDKSSSSPTLSWCSELASCKACQIESAEVCHSTSDNLHVRKTQRQVAKEVVEAAAVAVWISQGVCSQEGACRPVFLLFVAVPF